MFECLRKKKKKPTTTTPVSRPIETPIQAANRYSGVNEGNSRNPDWNYLARTIKLDDSNEKISTLQWYFRQFLKVSGELIEAEDLTALPHWFLAGIDMREMSFNHTGHFANGDKIIGTGKKTYRVPAGLGPAATWAISVRQAIDYEEHHNERFDQLVGPNMNFIDALEAWEIYNGLGFRSKGEYSEYVMAFTNHHDETGRYVADGRYSSSSKVVRPGAAAFVLYMLERGKVRSEELNGKRGNFTKIF